MRVFFIAIFLCILVGVANSNESIDQKSVLFTHHLGIRVSIPPKKEYGTDGGHWRKRDRLDPYRLKWRHKMLKELALASLINQTNKNFTVWIMTHKSLPKEMLDEYEQIVKGNDNFEIIYINRDMLQQWSDAIDEYDAKHGKNPRYLITTLLDDDDRIYPHGIETLQKHAKSLIDDNIDLGGILIGKGIDYCILDESSLEKEITFKECKRVDRVYTSCGASLVAKRETCNSPSRCNIYGGLSHSSLLDIPRYVNDDFGAIKYIKKNNLRVDKRIVDHPDIPFAGYTIHSTNDSNTMGRYKNTPPYYPH